MKTKTTYTFPLPYAGGKIYKSQFGFTTHWKPAGATSKDVQQKRHKTLDEAMHHLECLNNDIPNLTTKQTYEAFCAISELPKGVSLLEVVRYYNEHNKALVSEISFMDAVEQFLEEKKLSVREITLKNNRKILTRYIAETACEDKKVATFTTSEINDYLLNCKTVAVRLQAWTILHSFFTWAFEIKKYIKENPVAVIPRPKLIAKSFGDCLSVEDCAKVLKAASEYDDKNKATIGEHLLPYVSIAMFAGIRSAEILRLDSSNFNADSKYITINAEKAKTKRDRLIEMQDSLVQFLRFDNHALTNGKIYGGSEVQLRKHIQQIFKMAGVEYKRNILRKTCDSYTTAFLGDPSKAAYKLGHDPVVSETFYLKDTSKEEAKRFFSITPANLDFIIKGTDKPIQKMIWN